MNGGWRQIFFLPFFLRTIWWKFQFTSQATSWNDEVKRNERTLKMIVFSFFFRLLLTASDWKKKPVSKTIFTLVPARFSFYFDLALIFLLFRFNLRIRFFRHFALMFTQLLSGPEWMWHRFYTQAEKFTRGHSFSDFCG